MRNFSTRVPSKAIYAIPTSMAIELIPEMESILLMVMETGSMVDLTTSEEACICDLREWATSIQDTGVVTNQAKNGSFVYINMNTGHMALFVAAYGYGDYAFNGTIL